MTYNKTYKNTENVFGVHPETILKKYAHKIEQKGFRYRNRTGAKLILMFKRYW